MRIKILKNKKKQNEKENEENISEEGNAHAQSISNESGCKV